MQPHPAASAVVTLQSLIKEIIMPIRRATLLFFAFLTLSNVYAATDNAATPQDDGQWTMPAKNYASTRFSGLNQINAGNVKQLQVAWTFSTGILHGHEAAPLVVNNTMYVVTPYPNYLYALDLTKPGGDIKWIYKPHPDRASQGVACCDVVNRGAVYADGKIIYNTLDMHTVAVDAKSGKEVWKTKLGDINLGETITMAPLVVKNKVLVGNSGGEMGVRGWLTALDVSSGKQVWRAYSTGPDKDVLIGPDFKAPYEKPEKDLGVSTWPPNAWKIGGGTVWGWISYDPQANLIYYGTSNPGPWNPSQRPGDNKWTATVFARDADTGMAKWAVQYNPHDLHDYDGVNEHVLADLTINGKLRKVLLHPDRNGYLYMIDRLTGEIISAPPFAYSTSIKQIDLKTGRPILAPEKTPQQGVLVKDICPASPGGKDWQPTAWSPRTQLLYIPHNHLCMDVTASKVGYIAGTPYVGMEVTIKKGPGDYGGVFSAWDPVAGKEAWEIKEHYPVWSGALATAGDVVFYGTMDRWFKAVDAKTGQELWKFRTGSGIIGQPITYKGPDGRQYVAVLSGVGGWSGALVAGHLDKKVPYGALGFVNAVKDLPDATAAGGTLYVFALPESK
jgi:alcohol dehydrogenase (cytochrome c)